LVRTPHNGFSRTDSRGDTVVTVLSPITTLILIGLRGSGKTTIARLLAQRLNRQAIDLDDLTPTYLREKSAADALSKHGEPAFRRAELAALLDALKTPGTILALGGGTPTAPGVAELLESAKNQGRIVVIYLRASASAPLMRSASSSTSATRSTRRSHQRPSTPMHAPSSRSPTPSSRVDTVPPTAPQHPENHVFKNVKMS
jgi:shikimate kinase